MRTKTLLIAAAALATTIISSEAQTPVYSANIVGYVSRVLPANPNGLTSPTFAFVANPLDTGNNVLTNVLQGLPNGSKVLKWDYANASFDLAFTKTALGAGWSPAGSGTNTVNPGECFFIELPNGNTGGWTNTFVGTVLQGNLTNKLILPGFTAESFQVPLNTGVTNEALNAALPATPAGSKILMWDEAGQTGFSIAYTRTALGSGWSNPGGGHPTTPQVTPGTGFFVVNAASTNRPWAYNFTPQ